MLKDPSIGLQGGAFIEIGQAAIHVAWKRLDLKSRQDNAEIANLMEIRRN